VADSEANFVWTLLPDAIDDNDAVRDLLERGVLVRGGSALGRAGALRITVGTEEENARCLRALAELL
jgi:histidinol-phosphate aminotransferase